MWACAGLNQLTLAIIIQIIHTYIKQLQESKMQIIILNYINIAKETLMHNSLVVCKILQKTVTKKPMKNLPDVQKAKKKNQITNS